MMDELRGFTHRLVDWARVIGAAVPGYRA